MGNLLKKPEKDEPFHGLIIEKHNQRIDMGTYKELFQEMIKTQEGYFRKSEDSRKIFKKDEISNSSKSSVFLRRYCPKNNSDPKIYVGETFMSVKHLRFNMERFEDFEESVNELIAFSKSQGAANYIIPIYGICYLSGAKKEILICAPLMEFSLLEIYNYYVNKKTKFPEEFLQYIAHILIDALDSINQNGKSHGNIKPTNILFKLNGELQLCDYGMLYGNIYKSLGASTCVTGSKYWSLERYNNGKYNESKDDLWAIGMTLTEAILGQHPYAGKNLCIDFLHNKEGDDISSEVAKKIRAKDANHFYADITIDFIKSCLFVEKIRPTIKEIQNKPFYSKCEMKTRDKLQKGIEKFLQEIP